MNAVEEIGKRAKLVTSDVANLSVDIRNQILLDMSSALVANWQEIVAANKKDLDATTQLSGPMRNRLTLDQKTIGGIAASLSAAAMLADPLAGPYDNWKNHTGFKIVKKTLPLGVVAMIFEARPNVTVDAAALTFKSGNAVILRGGKEAIESNIILTNILRDVLRKHNLNPDIIQLITDTTHDSVNTLLNLRDYVDVLIPRGSGQFIDFVVKNATVPVIETGAGNTHIFVDESAKQDEAIRVIHNAKTQKPAVCNAAEKLLIHEAIAGEFLPKIVDDLLAAGVELRRDQKARSIDSRVIGASAEDWDTEYTDLIMAIKIVHNNDEAITWINDHTTHHSETIISEDLNHVTDFMNTVVDAAVVYQNVSSRFTDGFEFGFGAEIGISTQKLHARGPMRLNALCVNHN